MSAEQVVVEALRMSRYMGCDCCAAYPDDADWDNPRHLEMAKESIAALREHGYIVVRAPRVPFPGPHSDAHFMRSAANHIERGYRVGGSNLTATVLRLLRDVADALDATPPGPQQDGDGQ